MSCLAVDTVTVVDHSCSLPVDDTVTVGDFLTLLPSVDGFGLPMSLPVCLTVTARELLWSVHVNRIVNWVNIH